MLPERSQEKRGDEMVRSRPNVGPSGRAIRCLAAGVLATLGMKILWGQLAPMGSTLLGSGVQSGPADSLPPWLAFTILFGLPMAVSWLISYAVLRTSAIPQPFAPDRQRRLLWMPFCFTRYTEEHRRISVHPTIVPVGAVAVASVVIAFIAGLPQPAVRCQWQPTELRSVSPQEGRRHFEDALDALEQHGVPFVVRNATWERDLELVPRCGGAKNEMDRQTGEALAIAAQLTGSLRVALDLFLQLRCWWLDNSACSVDAIRGLFPKTLSEYKRARVAPFGSFAGDRLMHALFPDTGIGFAMLLDWTFMAIDSDQDYVGPGDGLACTSPAQMLGMPTTADAFAELVAKERNSSRGARDPLLSGTLDIFLTASAEHHNLLHRHHTYCTGMISVAWQLEGRKGWWLYPPSATAELGPPSVVSGCCETWLLSPSNNPPLLEPWPMLSRCWGVELGPGDFLFFSSWPPHFAKPLSPMVSAISHLSACGARRGERATVLWPQGEALNIRTDGIKGSDGDIAGI